MTNLPITHLTLYKHGVGFFERRAHLSGEEVDLSFRVEEMNDVLKSLTAIDRGGGQVLGLEYATPISRDERLAGCSIRLADDRSIRDLLTGLRGRRVRLLLDQGEQLAGILLGLDEVAERQPLSTSLVSILLDDGGDLPPAQVQAVDLGRVQGVEILDERGAGDLRFFLQTALSQENYRLVKIRLSPGEHELSVSYIAPAPTWRVSYRLVTEPETRDADAGTGRALLLGWGIFDNRLEEDLQAISLALVAGMPISFIYDLYHPVTPSRPVIEEEARVAAGPVDFEARTMGAIPEAADMAPAPMAMRSMAAGVPPPAPARAKMSREEMAQAAPVTTTGEALGELFQYVIGTPVTVGRGQSAMVPIVSADLGYRKDLLYNGIKLATHPVATLRLKNESGLTLERGPVTVLENGEYVGEAVLPFSVAGGEVVVPYAVELAIKVREESGASREIRSLYIRGIYLLFEEWDMRWREYRLSNSTGQAHAVLVEHPRTVQFELFDTPEPKEKTDDQLRFEIQVPARGEQKLRVQERRLIRRQEELRRLTPEVLESYRSRGLLDRKAHDQAAELLKLWAKIADNEQRLAELDKDRQKVYKAQQQIQGNMGALSATGKEGALRAQYVDQLQASEEQLKAIDQREAALKAEIENLKQEVEARLRAL